MAFNAQQLENQIDEAKAQLAAAQSGRESTDARLRALDTERRNCVIDARVGNDAAAKKKLAQVESDIDKLSREARTDETLISELSRRIEKLSLALAEGSWDRRCEKVAALMQKRMKDGSEKKLSDLIDQVIGCLEEMRESGERIGRALRELDPALGLAANWIALADDRAGDVVLCRLQRANFIRVPVNSAWREMVLQQGLAGPATFTKVMASLDSLRRERSQKFADADAVLEAS